MNFHYLLALCFIVLFSTTIEVKAQESDVDVADRANPIVKAVTKAIGGLFVGAAAGCLGGAIAECKSKWRHAHEAVDCAKEYLKKNQGKCATGR